MLNEDLSCQDPIVVANMKLLAERSNRGLETYGTTLQNNKLTRAEWLQHALEEALDLANYLQKLIQEEKNKE